MPLPSPQTFEFVEPVPLSPVESYFWRFEEDLIGAFRVTVLMRLDGCIEADFLAAALRRLQGRHPKLRAKIVQGNDRRLRYHFASVAPPIPFEITDYDEDETPWREETRRLLQNALPAAGPLAAVTVLRSRSRGRSELLLTVTHAIADGLSAIMLVNDLLTEYAKAEARLDVPPLPALPVFTAGRAKSSGGWRGRLWLLRRFSQLKREERGSSFTSLPEARDIPPQSQWVHWVFSRKDTLALVRRCRKEQASISGALVAAAYRGLMDCLPVSEALFRWQLPFNIRESLEGPAGPVTAEDLGCFVTNMNGSIKLPKQSAFWDLARRAHQEIQAFVQQGGPSFGYNIAYTFYGMGMAIRRLFSGSASKLTPAAGMRATLLATNYGVLNIQDQYGSLHPRACTLIFKNDTTGPSLIMEALVMSQRLNIGFAADDLEPAFWEQLQVAVRKHMDAAAGDGEAVFSKSEPHQVIG